MAIAGSTVWGHITGVFEDNVRTWSGNWTGTGTISGSGDSEYISLMPDEYLISEIVDTGGRTIYLGRNIYVAGGDVVTYYRTAATEVGIESATWNMYDEDLKFDSLGYVQVKLINEAEWYESDTWYLTTGVVKSDVLAAYRPKGAPTQSGARVDIVNPGTYNLTLGSGSWASATGFTLPISPSGYLSIGNSGFTLSGDCTILARITYTAWSGQWILFPNFNGLGLNINAGSNRLRLSFGPLTFFADSSNAPVSGGVAGATYDTAGNYVYYRDGSADGSGTNDQTISASCTMFGYTSGSIGGNMLAMVVYSMKLSATQVADVTTNMNAL